MRLERVAKPKIGRTVSQKTSCDFRHFSRRLPLLVNVHSKNECQGPRGHLGLGVCDGLATRVPGAPLLEERAVSFPPARLSASCLKMARALFTGSSK